MKTCKTLLLPLLSTLLFLPTALHADPIANLTPGTFVDSSLGSDQGRGILGLDTAGTFVYFALQSCPNTLSSNCYSTINSGWVTSVFQDVPAITFDNGATCSGTGARAPGISEGTCNGSFSLFTVGSDLFNGALKAGLYSGSPLDPLDATLLFRGVVGSVKLNSVGDYAFDDQRNDQLYIHYIESNSTVPEPGSLALIGTGGLAAFAGLRRRLFS